MATFPILKTGSIAQYPLVTDTRFATQSVSFMDGSRQRYRLIGAGLRQWTINFSQLDEQELNAMILFVEQQGGAHFPFTDPVTGDNVARCVISGEQFDASMKREIDGQVSLVIEEIP